MNVLLLGRGFRWPSHSWWMFPAMIQQLMDLLFKGFYIQVDWLFFRIRKHVFNLPVNQSNGLMNQSNWLEYNQPTVWLTILKTGQPPWHSYEPANWFDWLHSITIAFHSQEHSCWPITSKENNEFRLLWKWTVAPCRTEVKTYELYRPCWGSDFCMPLS